MANNVLYDTLMLTYKTDCIKVRYPQVWPTILDHPLAIGPWRFLKTNP